MRTTGKMPQSLTQEKPGSYPQRSNHLTQVSSAQQSQWCMFVSLACSTDEMITVTGFAIIAPDLWACCTSIFLCGSFENVHDCYVQRFCYHRVIIELWQLKPKNMTWCEFTFFSFRLCSGDQMTTTRTKETCLPRNVEWRRSSRRRRGRGTWDKLPLTRIL